MFQLAKSIDDAIAPIGDGCMLVVPREVSGVPMAATRALIRRGVKRIHLVALPTSSLQADLLIGAGCVETLETSAVSLGEFGPAPRFTAAVTSGAIKMKDATCPALHAALQASEKGVPFMPLRGLIGSDVLKYRDDWKVIDSPFGRRRSNRAAARDQAGRGADPRADGGPFRQCLDRAATRACHHGPRGRQNHRNRRKNPRRQSAGRSHARRRYAAGLLRRNASRSPSAAPGRWDCRISMPPMPTILPSTRAWRRRRRASPSISTSMCMRKGSMIEVRQLS